LYTVTTCVFGPIYGDEFIHYAIMHRTTEHLGSGQFGNVEKGVWSSPRGPVDVAVKQLNEGMAEGERVKFLREAAIMGQFRHPHVIKLHGVVTMGEPVRIYILAQYVN